MKKVQKTLSAALAATLATGVLGSVASATPLDDLYKAAYEATMNALNKKDQESINAARAAIDKLPKELQGFKGELSKQVDSVQHPILVKIVDAINKAKGSLKQADINEARKAIPAALTAEWKNSYSVAVDGIQQDLQKKVVAAVETAIKTQKAEDIKAAQELIAEIKTTVSEDTKKWAETFEKDFAAKIKLVVTKVDVLGANTIKVNFNREVDPSTVAKQSFVAAKTDSKEDTLFVSKVVVAEDNKSVTVTFFEALAADKEYTLDTVSIKDANGVVMEADTDTFTYVAAAPATVTLNAKTVNKAQSLTKYVVIKDSLGRDITKSLVNAGRVSFETSDDSIVDQDGLAVAEGNAIVSVVILDEEGNVTDIKSEDTIIRVRESAVKDFQGFLLWKNADVADIIDTVYSDIDSADRNTTINMGEELELAMYFKDQFGEEVAPVTTDFTIKNLTPDVVIVSADGHVTPVSAGTGYVKVTVGGVDKTITIEVKGAAVPTTLTLDKTAINMAVYTGEDHDSVGNSVVVTVKDQYGKAPAIDKGTVTVLYKDAKGKYVPVDEKAVADVDKDNNIALNANGQVAINLTPKQKGTNTYKVQYIFGTKTLETTFTVTVKQTTELANYEVTTVSSLDVFNNPATSANESVKTLSVYAVDTNGNRMYAVTSDVKVEVLDKDSNDASAKVTTTGNGGLTLTALEAGTYTVKVRVGTKLVKSFTLTVKDSTVVAKTVIFNAFEMKEGADLRDLITVKDSEGKEIKKADYTIDTVSGYETNEVKVDGVVVSYDLVIKSITITVGDEDNTQRTVTLPKPQIIKIKK